MFGDGKTALKVSLNRYLENLSAGSSIAQDPNPLNTIVTQTTRSWNDANRNYVPDCNLQSSAANGECGAMANSLFGQPVPGNTYDPDLMHGWFKRAYNWEFSSGVQHEVMTRTSVDVSYFRRVYGNFRVTDNRVLGPADFDKFDVTAPGGPASARWRRLRRARHVQPEPREVRPGVGQPGHACEQLRRPGRVLARRRRQHRDAAHPRADAPGRHEHRPHGAGQLRAQGAGAGAGGIARHVRPDHHRQRDGARVPATRRPTG